jgi:hypothetical protein
MRLTICRAVPLVLLLAAPAGLAHAQKGRPVGIGERVRITVPAGYGRERITGRLTGLSGDSATLQRDGDAGSQSIPISSITKVESSVGMRTSGRRWMGYGFLLGAGTGAALAAATHKKGSGPQCLPDDFLFCTGPMKRERGVNASTGALFGGLLGMTVGGIAGRFHHSERWTRRTLGSSRPVGVGPAPGGRQAVRISVAFGGSASR